MASMPVACLPACLRAGHVVAMWWLFPCFLLEAFSERLKAHEGLRFVDGTQGVGAK